VACDVWGLDDTSNEGDCRDEGQHSCVPYLESQVYSCVPSGRLLFRHCPNGWWWKRQIRGRWGQETSEHWRRISVGLLRQGVDLEFEARDEWAELHDVYIERVRSVHAYDPRGIKGEVEWRGVSSRITLRTLSFESSLVPA
jgi:hypothetical protein